VKRRFLQFSLRGLFVATLVVGAFFGGTEFGAKREQQRLESERAKDRANEKAQTEHQMMMLSRFHDINQKQSERQEKLSERESMLDERERQRGMKYSNALLREMARQLTAAEKRIKELEARAPSGDGTAPGAQ